MIKLRNLDPSLRALIEGAAAGVSLSPNANLIYVDSGHRAAGDGKPGSEPGNPLATIDAAFTASATAVSASNGDIVIVMPGHTETLTSAITMDVIGVTVLGLGQGTSRPQLTVSGGIDGVTVTAANTVVSGLYFNEAGAAGDVDINIGAANVTVTNCHFDLATQEDCITIEDAGDTARIVGNKFNVTGAGPDSGVLLEAAGVDGVEIAHNYFVCSAGGANTFDAGAIETTAAHTDLYIHDNTFNGAGQVSTAVSGASALTRAVVHNTYVSDAVDVDVPANLIELEGVSAKHAVVGDGRTWYVSSTGGNAAYDGLAPNRALVTVNAAIDAASAGDTIYVMEAHVETLSDAATLIPDVAGQKIIGLGRGARRPTLTFDNASGNIPISGEGVLFENFLFVSPSGTVNVAAGITVTAADVAIRNIEVRDSANNQWVDFIVLAAGSARAHVDGLRMINVIDAASETAVSIVGGVVDGVILENLDIDGGFTTAVLENITNVATNLTIRNSRLRQRHATIDAVIDVVATTTGWIDGVRIRVATDDFAGFSGVLVDADDMQIYDTLVVNADGEQGSPPVSVFSSANPFAVDMSKWNVVTKVQDVSADGTDDLFTVVGKVLVTSFVGDVTEAVQAVSTDITMRAKTTNAALSAETLVDGDSLDTLYTVPGNETDTMVAAHAGVFILDGITVESLIAGTPSTGIVEWTLCYVPLEAAANVVAA